MNIFYLSQAGWHHIGIISLLGIFVFFFIIKSIFSFIIDTVTSSLYPDYHPLEDKILMKVNTLDRVMSAEEFSKTFSCDYSLLIKMLTNKKIQGYKEEGVWYLSIASKYEQ